MAFAGRYARHACDRAYRCVASRVAHPMQDESGCVRRPRGYAIQPCGRSARARPMSYTYCRDRAVLLAFVVDARPSMLVIAHVDECDPARRRSPGSASAARGKSGVDEQQPQPRFLRRLRSAVHQVSAIADVPQYPVRPGYRSASGSDVGCGDACGPGQRIEVANSRDRVAGDGRDRMQCVPEWSTGSPSNVDDLVGVDPLVAHDDARRRTTCCQIISIGVDASTHSAPCRAAAARPAMTPRRPDHSQAPTVFA